MSFKRATRGAGNVRLALVNFPQFTHPAGMRAAKLAQCEWNVLRDRFRGGSRKSFRDG